MFDDLINNRFFNQALTDGKTFSAPNYRTEKSMLLISQLKSA
jgi:hypothetical protein